MTSKTNLHNFAYDLLPQKWEDYYGHESAKALARRFLLEKPVQSVFLCGGSGLGKTAFVLLLIKSMRCLNRPAGEMNPCGECAACKDSDVRLAEKSLTDVFWLQPGGNAEKSLGKEVTEALLVAEKGHRYTGKGSQDLLVVILDEFHGFSTDVRRKLFQKAELRNDRTNVVYFFITMQPESLNATERVAFKRRGAYLELKPFSEEELVKFLKFKFPDCPTTTAKLIAEVSENSTGLALMYYDHVKEQDASLDPEVAAMLLSLANNSQRLEIWEHLKNKGKIVDLKSKLDRLCRFVSPQQLSKQLLNDIFRSADKNPNGPSDSQLFAVRLFNQYCSNYANVDLHNYLVELYGLDLIKQEAILEPDDHSLGYSIQ